MQGSLEFGTPVLNGLEDGERLNSVARDLI